MMKPMHSTTGFTTSAQPIRKNGITIINRNPHWIRPNHQNRIPKRWIAFDTEANSDTHDNLEIQTWKMGAAIFWRHGLKKGDYAEHRTFDTPLEFWESVANFCRPGARTVCVAHNLGYDARISDCFATLPKLGFSLEWCNLDSNISSMTWRSAHGTLVLSDLWTWLPVKLGNISTARDIPKLAMPASNAPRAAWDRYCMRDAEIVYQSVKELIEFIDKEDLGNWQPTGAGMSYATWRHKFMTHKVLVHDDIDALAAERQAMWTGRAEAWRHGTFYGETWTEVDMRNAYVTIASECDMPTKIKYRTGALSNDQFNALSASYRCLAYCRVSTDIPVLPTSHRGRTIWPTGTFTGWYWDTEIDTAIAFGAQVNILDCITYTRKPILQDWANWVIGILRSDDDSISPVIKTWQKHCSRALIGRMSLRTPSWKPYASNPLHDTGIVWETNPDTGETYRLMSVGDTVFKETERTEYKDSLPQVTGWIMSECRSRLMWTMHFAGYNNIAHVDTDSLLVNRSGLDGIKHMYGSNFTRLWQLKASYNRLTIYGPRNYRPDRLRKTSGVPKNAEEISPNSFMGESWHGVADDLAHGRPDRVTIERRPYNLRTEDPRRLDAPGVPGVTVAIQV